MSNTTASRLGELNLGGGDAKELFYKVFSQEVLTAYDRHIVTEGLHRVRNITNGKSAGFAVMGTAGASYHTVGDDILDASNGYLNQIAHGEKVINIDDLLVAPVFVSLIDELMNNYEVRGEYAHQLGQALANEFDRNVLQVATLAARASANITGGFGGSVLTQSDVTGLGDTGASIAEAIYEASVVLDEKDIPEMDRVCILRPKEYSMLARDKDIQNGDYGGAQLYLENRIPHVAGVKILKSNNLPSTNVTANAGENNTYGGDFSDTVGTVFQKDAIGTVRMLGVGLEDEYSVQHQGTLMVAKTSVGHGILRPECAVELSKAAS